MLSALTALLPAAQHVVLREADVAEHADILGGVLIVALDGEVRVALRHLVERDEHVLRALELAAAEQRIAVEELRFGLLIAGCGDRGLRELLSARGVVREERGPRLEVERAATRSL